MAKVGIVMGSDSDMPIMSKAADILEKLGIDYAKTPVGDKYVYEHIFLEIDTNREALLQIIELVTPGENGKGINRVVSLKLLVGLRYQ